MRWPQRSLYTALIVALVCVWAGMVSTPQSAAADRADRQCHFRQAIWGAVQATATVAASAAGYNSTVDVETDRSPLQQELNQALVRYNYPRGWYYLVATWSQTWGHVWGSGWWEHQYWEDMSSNLDTSYDRAQRDREEAAARDAMTHLWWAANHVC